MSSHRKGQGLIPGMNFFQVFINHLGCSFNSENHPLFPFISSWKFNYDLFHIFSVNPVFVRPFVMKGNG